MIWCIIAVLAVLAVKFATSLRLKDMRAKLEGIKPHIDELRVKVAEAEDEYASLELKEQATQARLTHLKGMVSYLEGTVKTPANTMVMDERQQVLEAAEDTG